MAQNPQLPEIPGYEARVAGGSSVPMISIAGYKGTNPMAAQFSAFSQTLTQTLGAHQKKKTQAEIDKQIAEGEEWRLTSQKTFKQAIIDGDIHPTQSPWFLASAMEADGELGAVEAIGNIKAGWDVIADDENDPRGRDPEGFDQYFDDEMDKFVDANQVDSHYWNNKFFKKVLHQRELLSPVAEASARDRLYVFETDKAIDKMVIAVGEGELDIVQEALDGADLAGYNDANFRGRFIKKVKERILESPEPWEHMDLLGKLRYGPVEQGDARPYFMDLPEIQADGFSDTNPEIMRHVMSSLEIKNSGSLTEMGNAMNATILRSEIFNGLQIPSGTAGHITIGEGVDALETSLSEAKAKFIATYVDDDGLIEGVAWETHPSWIVTNAKIAVVRDTLTPAILAEEAKLRGLTTGLDTMMEDNQALLDAGVDGIMSQQGPGGTNTYNIYETAISGLVALEDQDGKNLYRSRSAAERAFNQYHWERVNESQDPELRNREIVNLALAGQNIKNHAASEYVGSRINDLWRGPLHDPAAGFPARYESLEDAVRLAIALDNAGQLSTLDLTKEQKDYIASVRQDVGNSNEVEDFQMALMRSAQKARTPEHATVSGVSTDIASDRDGYFDELGITPFGAHRDAVNTYFETRVASYMEQYGATADQATTQVLAEIEEQNGNGKVLLDETNAIWAPLENTTPISVEEHVGFIRTNIIDFSRLAYDTAYTNFNGSEDLSGLAGYRDGVTLLEAIRREAGDSYEEPSTPGGGSGPFGLVMPLGRYTAPGPLVRRQKNTNRDMAWYNKYQPHHVKRIVDAVRMVPGSPDPNFSIQITDASQIHIQSISTGPNSPRDAVNMTIMIEIPADVEGNPSTFYPYGKGTYNKHEVNSWAEQAYIAKQEAFYNEPTVWIKMLEAIGGGRYGGN